MSASRDARSSPITSGRLATLDELALAAGARGRSRRTHSPARRTSSRCAASALMLGMRRSSESSSSQA